tara:strand:+ start:205 stop:378 length:174 start_codon:yes stop_codon:yes gene_type:complete
MSDGAERELELSSVLEEVEEVEELVSSVAHDPIKTKTPVIKNNQKLNFFITTSLSLI